MRRVGRVVVRWAPTIVLPAFAMWAYSFRVAHGDSDRRAMAMALLTTVVLTALWALAIAMVRSNRILRRRAALLSEAERLAFEAREARRRQEAP